MAAILYRPEHDVDALLADFAAALLRDGERIGDVVQGNIKEKPAGRTACTSSIFRPHGRFRSVCRAVRHAGARDVLIYFPIITSDALNTAKTQSIALAAAAE